MSKRVARRLLQSRAIAAGTSLASRRTDGRLRRLGATQRPSRKDATHLRPSLNAVDGTAPRPPRRMPCAERHLRADVDGSDESDASHEPSYRFPGTTMT